DFRLNRLDRDVHVEGVKGDQAVDVLPGKAEPIGGEAKVDPDFLRQLQHLIQRLVNHRLAAPEGNVKSFSPQLLCLSHHPEHHFPGKHRLGDSVNGAKGAGEIAASAENNVISGRGGQDFAGLQGEAPGNFFLEIGQALDGAAGQS